MNPFWLFGQYGWFFVPFQTILVYSHFYSRLFLYVSISFQFKVWKLISFISLFFASQSTSKPTFSSFWANLHSIYISFVVFWYIFYFFIFINSSTFNFNQYIICQHTITSYLLNSSSFYNNFQSIHSSLFSELSNKLSLKCAKWQSRDISSFIYGLGWLCENTKETLTNGIDQRDKIKRRLQSRVAKTKWAIVGGKWRYSPRATDVLMIIVVLPIFPTLFPRQPNISPIKQELILGSTALILEKGSSYGFFFKTFASAANNGSKVRL